ncbi:hypothetical protein J437_LFUL008846 [Ladona fulva]|uniref:Hexosyltransferase n=1 Tax=Ladona fulva TaxID=123851 RepID=A0A8K0P4M7_LADFU|nr:hypothetical protein J437_LFUL008846 [Ladona fulva]
MSPAGDNPRRLNWKKQPMASFKIRVLHSVLVLVAVSLVIYSSYCTTPLQVPNMERPEEAKGQNLTQPQPQQTPELGIPVNPVKAAPSIQPEDPSTGLSSASLVAYPLVSSPSLSSANLMPTVTDHSTNSSYRPMSDEGIKSLKDSEAGPKVAKNLESLSQTVASSHAVSLPTEEPMARGVITSSLYAAGHDIPAPDLCPDAGSGMRLLILVTSAPKHTDARMAIRQTWGHFGARRDVSVGFFVASSAEIERQHLLESESALYGDIIRANFLDSYVNLTLKTISMQEWVDTYCPKVRFILKTDDDMFINVPRLLTFTEKHMGEKRTIYGRLAKKWKPIRNSKSKYYVSVKQYKHSVFPDFTTGPAYLLTSDTVHDLYVTSLNKTYLHLEDVFITGIVAQDIKIRRVHSQEFFNKRIPFHACNIQKGISIHKVKFPEQFDLWKKLLDGRTACKV